MGIDAPVGKRRVIVVLARTGGAIGSVEEARASDGITSPPIMPHS